MSDILSSIKRSSTGVYTAYKNWTFSSSSFLTNNIQYLRGQYSNSPVIISASSAIGEIQNYDSSYVKNTYINLNHLYYNTHEPFGFIKYPINSFNRELNSECIIYSIPQSKVGTSIKKESVLLTVNSPTNTLISLRDNGNYELIDVAINTSSFVEPALIYLGFNQEFNQSYKQPYINNNVTFVPGIRSSNYSFGYAAYFNGTSSIQVQDNGNNWSEYFNNDFTISFWISASSTLSSIEPLTLISKKWDNVLLQTCPFDISYDTFHRIISFSYTNSYESKTISSVNTVSDAFTHVVCQKSGSQLQIFINGSTETSDPLINNIPIKNTSPIFLGATNLSNLNAFTGILDEVRFYNKALTTTEILYLSFLEDYNYTAMQTNKVGNVFYEDGIIVYSPLQNEIVSSSYQIKNTSITYKSSLDIEQQRYYLNIPMDKYNVSLNPTLYDLNSNIKSFATSSEFTPYITTVGLYDGNYNLVAIAKLGSPIAKRNDIDLNIEIKFDKS